MSIRSYSIRVPRMIMPGVAPRRTEQSFALQYTALILIILTFIVGAFIRPHLPAEATSADPVSTSPYEFGLVQYKDMFIEDTVNEEVMSALIEIGLSHDVLLKITVHGSPDSEIDNETRIAEAVSRSVALQRHLIDHGMPFDAMDVRATSRRRNFQAELRIMDLPEQKGVQ